MGLYNRDYMRESEPGGSPIRLRGLTLTTWLIILNCAVFLMFLVSRGNSLNDVLNAHFITSHYNVFHYGRVHTLLTACFAHFGFFHLLFNMWGLHLFGRDLEQVYGKKDFAVLYLGAGLIGNLAQVLAFPDNPVLGASGCVLGLVVAYACFFPNRQLMLFPIPVTLTVKWLAIGYAAISFFGITNQATSSTAFAAHLGGMAFGFLYYRLDLRIFSKRRGSRGPLLPRLRLRNPFRRSKLRLHSTDARGSDGRTGRPPGGLRDHHRKLDARAADRLDSILEKIALHGTDSLDDEERAFLQEASHKLRRG